VCMAAMINHVSVSFSAVQMYDLSYVRLCVKYQLPNPFKHFIWHIHYV